MSEITSLIKTLQKDNKDRAKLDTQRTEDIRAMREAQIGDVGNKGAEIEATKEATANSKKTTNLLKTMSGSLTGILGATKKLGAAAKSSFFGALKGLAFGAFLLAVGNFLDSPTFKKLTKKIGEITQKFADRGIKRKYRISWRCYSWFSCSICSTPFIQRFDVWWKTYF